jgi:hypothetical protein
MQYEQKPITERSLLLGSAREAIEGPLGAVLGLLRYAFQCLLYWRKQTLNLSESAAVMCPKQTLDEIIPAGENGN